MASTTDLAYLSLREASVLVEGRKVSPLELTDACIARAEALEPRINAYITRTFDTARQEARAAEGEIAAGRRKGPLHGVPFAIKDLYETAGVITTAGSALREHYVPAEDAETVRRLKDAGVVLLGKLSLHEWAMGGTNVQSYYPTPRNAWDLSRITGGSSGGSGTALAAGYCYGSLGSDTRGSIRIPASLCGVSGIKPTYGRVSLRGVVPLSWSLDHAGPMARTAYDCALILSVIAGYDPRDPTCADRPVEEYTDGIEASLAGVRIGVPRNWFFDEGFTEPEITRIVRASRDVFASLGATISDIDFPGPLDWDASVAFGAESAWYHKENVAAHPDKYSEPTRLRIEMQQNVTGMDYQRARWQQLELQQGVRELFRGIDLVLTPTSPIPPMRIEEAPAWQPSGNLLARNTSPFNVAHVPTVSVTCGFDSLGLPVGLSLAGRWWDEALVLRAAHAYQTATDWHMKRPALD
jgi:aspartyl-tRNA(Asn)/glutamyl-tRNA(Gln) amidotransferase subunit A